MSESTYDSPQTIPTTDHRPYYSYRVTVCHDQIDGIINILDNYSQDYCGVMHGGDSDTAAAHFHIIMLDFDVKKVDAFRKRMTVCYNAKGNEFHAGKFMKNDFMEALTYFSHDNMGYFHKPADKWIQYISKAPAWVKHDKVRPPKDHRPRERLGDPTLTYSNLVKQALLYRTEHKMDSNSLERILDTMVQQSSWIPSRDLVSNGVPLDLHRIFQHRMGLSVYKGKWSQPHTQSEKKKEWADQPMYYHDPNLIQSDQTSI